MRLGRLPAILCALLALAAAIVGVWIAIREPAGGTTKTADIHDKAADGLGDNQPLQMPARERTSPDEPAPGTEPPPTPAVEPAVEPEYYVPDYGPAIMRGGARIDIELRDANGQRMGVGGFEATLWRAVGDFWIEEDAIVDTHAGLVRCVGLGLPGLEPTGLEPGSYEIALASESSGCARHQFDVARGEQRIELVTLPVWSRQVCFTFVHPDGSPVSCIPWLPKVITTSKPLVYTLRPDTPDMEFRRPPTEPDHDHMGGGGGSGGGSSWIETRRRSDNPARYATDDGRWWVTVKAGCNNTVSFHLGEALWGQQSYSFTDDFTITDSQTVTLNTAAEFNEQVLNPGHIVESFEPGNRGILNTAPPPEVDLRTMPLAEGKTRLIVRVLAPCGVAVSWRAPGENLLQPLYRSGDLHWTEFPSMESCEIQMDPAGRLPIISETLDTSAGGVVFIERALPIRLVDLPGEGFSPTLDAFAHAWTIELTTKSDQACTLEFQRIDGRLRALALADETGDYGHCTLTLRGADRFHQPPDGYRTTITDTGTSYQHSRRFYAADPVTSRPVQLSESSVVPGFEAALEFRPKWQDVLVFRAVDEMGAGLPGVQGLLLDYADDAVATRVRELSALQEHAPRIVRDNAVNYAVALENADKSDAVLKELIGDAWGVFENNDQRLWFARHGAWYHRRMRVSGDKHGYVADQVSALEAGRAYVLYLWGGSRDDLRPEARIVFKAGDGVTDLGAIALPTYLDR